MLLNDWSVLVNNHRSVGEQGQKRLGIMDFGDLVHAGFLTPSCRRAKAEMRGWEAEVRFLIPAGIGASSPESTCPRKPRRRRRPYFGRPPGDSSNKKDSTPAVGRSGGRGSVIYDASGTPFRVQYQEIGLPGVVAPPYFAEATKEVNIQHRTSNVEHRREEEDPERDAPGTDWSGTLAATVFDP